MGMFKHWWQLIEVTYEYDMLVGEQLRDLKSLLKDHVNVYDPWGC